MRQVETQSVDFGAFADKDDPKAMMQTSPSGSSSKGDFVGKLKDTQALGGPGMQVVLSALRGLAMGQFPPPLGAVDASKELVSKLLESVKVC